MSLYNLEKIANGYTGLLKIAAARNPKSEKNQIIAILREANKDLFFDTGSKKDLTKSVISNMLKSTKPIKREGKVVGFTMPGKTKEGDDRLGNIYVAKSERRKGYGYEAAKEFVDSHKNVAWFAHKKNRPSISLAKKLGLKYSKREQGRPDKMVFKKAS